MRRKPTELLKNTHRCKHLCASVAFLCLIMTGCLPHIIKSRPILANTSDLPGIWLGRDQQYWGSVYRLELNGDGTGLLAVSSHDTPQWVRLYEVTHWKAAKGNFRCDLCRLPAAKHGLPLKMRGTASPDSMSLELDEETGSSGWHRRPTMVREDQFFTSLDQQRRAALEAETTMNDHHAKGAVNVE